MSDYAQAGSYSVFGQAADMLPMLTPAAVLLVAIGVRVAFVRGRYDVLASSVFAIIAVALMTAGVMYAKYFIIVMPVIAILAHWAYEHLMKGPRYVVAVFWLIALLPWLVGVKLIVAGSSWGPGFEVRSEGSMARAGFSRNPDGRVTLHDASIGLQAGYAVPVQDGYRPIYGYLYLFLGSWRELVDSMENEE